MQKRFLLPVLVLALTTSTQAHDIEGVQPAALDQPRINIHLRREIKGKALTTGTGKKDEESAINIQAFLDTGASGILLSGKTASALGVKHENAKGAKSDVAVRFHDVGVGGTDAFDVSEKLFIFIAPYSTKSEPDQESEYPLSVGPVRTQISSGAGLIEMLTGGLDVLGVPAMKGKIVIIDPKPVDKFDDMMKCGLYERGKVKIPPLDRHVKLTYVDFKPFTRLEPANAEWPSMAANPMIGPSPVASAAGKTPAPQTPSVIAKYKGQEVSGTWLLDTGAAASMISTKQAAKLGVTYAAGTIGTDNARLDGIPKDKQFSISVGGVGGTKKAAGFFLDALVIPTKEGDPLIYKPAPVLVNDISAEDPQTKETITLDGVLGMNYLSASAFLSQEGLLPDIKNMTVGPYEWIVIDEPQATLGLKLKK
jgi:hypothetical protein